MNIPTAKRTIQLSEDSTITISQGDLAMQAHGRSQVAVGKAILLATVVEREEKEQGAFLPLSVDYQEKFSSIGRFPGGFFKRESKLNNFEIISSRLTDRAIRPLFPKHFFNSVQVNVTLLSGDVDVIPDTLAMLAASTALSLSPIPFYDPVASVRIGKVNGTLCINPSPSQLAESPIDVVVAGTKERVMMLEAKAEEISEDELLSVIKMAHAHIITQCEAQESLAATMGIEKRAHVFSPTEEQEALQKSLKEKLYPLFYEVVAQGIKTKQARSAAFSEAKEKVLETLDPEQLESHRAFVSDCIAAIKREAIRTHILKEKKRIDGRASDEVRPIDIKVDYLPSAHGSAVFTRGDTQVLATLTLGGSLDVQYLDGVSVQGESRFIVHYNFPGFSTGEVKPNRGPGRRETGHGNLVSKGLSPMLPETPYTLRLTTDTLSSDGSSSMASVCSGSLALMDAGIPIKKPVAGIAMGLIVAEGEAPVILSDISSEEDACGDADFKIVGTAEGITACQMDIKTDGISFDVLKGLLTQAKQSRMHILGKMNAVRSTTRPNQKPHAPVIKEISIKPSMIGKVIGPGGKVIQDIQKTTGAKISITEEGLVSIFAPTQDMGEKAFERVALIVVEPELQKTYKGKVVSVMPYGLFVEFLPNKQGLVHHTAINIKQPIQDLGKHFKEGDPVDVKLVSIFKPKGERGESKFKLSMEGL